MCNGLQMVKYQAKIEVFIFMQTWVFYSSFFIAIILPEIASMKD